jgi:hypothetical protein
MRTVPLGFGPLGVRPVAIAATLLAAGVGCAGPTVPLSADVTRFATTVQFGSDAVQPVFPVPGVALPPQSNFNPGTGTVLAPPPYLPLEPPVVHAPATCPVASPLAGFAVPAGNDFIKPPKPATYVFRNRGSIVTASGKQTYPATGTRTIQDVAKNTTTGGWTYHEISRIGTTVTSTGYQYVPTTSASGTGAGSQQTSGLFITSIVATSGKTVVLSFTPPPPGLLLVETPAVSGNEWYATASDPSSQITMTWTARQRPDEAVDACGKLIQSVHVHLDGSISVHKDAGSQFGLCPPPNNNVPTCIPEKVDQDTGKDPGASQTGPNQVVSYRADYDVAPQYGIVVSTTTNSQSGSSATCATTPPGPCPNGQISSLVSIIDALPKAP